MNSDVNLVNWSLLNFIYGKCERKDTHQSVFGYLKIAGHW